MIELAPFTPDAALQVFRFLDPADLSEARAMRGFFSHYLDIYTDWSVHQRSALLSLVLKTGGKGGVPFAVLALSNTGQAGVAQAALLARNHTRYRRPLAEAGARIRREMPEFCRKAGVYRIEARCAYEHPSAQKFLGLCGFRKEAVMPGFGTHLRYHFCQFAWTLPPQSEGT